MSVSNEELYDRYKEVGDLVMVSELYGMPEDAVHKAIKEVQTRKDTYKKAVEHTVSMISSGKGMRDVKGWLTDSMGYSFKEADRIYGEALSEVHTGKRLEESKPPVGSVKTTSRGRRGSRVDWSTFYPKVKELLEKGTPPSEAMKILSISPAKESSFRAYYSKVQKAEFPNLDFRARQRVPWGKKRLPLNETVEASSDSGEILTAVPQFDDSQGNTSVGEKKEILEDAGVKKEFKSPVKETSENDAGEKKKFKSSKVSDEDAEETSEDELRALRANGEGNMKELNAYSFALAQEYHSQVLFLDSLIELKSKEIEQLRGMRKNYAAMCRFLSREVEKVD